LDNLCLGYQSCANALVLYVSLNDLLKSVGRAQVRCAIVMRFRHTVVSVMQQRTCEMRLRAAMNGSGASDSSSEQMRADRDADGGPCGFGDNARDGAVGHRISVVGRKPQGRG